MKNNRVDTNDRKCGADFDIEAQLKTILMVDICVPTVDGRKLVLSRYTQPQAEQRMLLDQLCLRLPEQPPPRITATHLALAAQTLLAVQWRPSLPTSSNIKHIAAVGAG